MFITGSEVGCPMEGGREVGHHGDPPIVLMEGIPQPEFQDHMYCLIIHDRHTALPSMFAQQTVFDLLDRVGVLELLGQRNRCRCFPVSARGQEKHHPPDQECRYRFFFHRSSTLSRVIKLSSNRSTYALFQYSAFALTECVTKAIPLN